MLIVRRVRKKQPWLSVLCRHCAPAVPTARKCHRLLLMRPDTVPQDIHYLRTHNVLLEITACMQVIDEGLYYICFQV